MNPLAINTVGDELESASDYCRQENLGIEVTEFIFPNVLDKNLAIQIARHAKAIDGIRPVSLHGPFYELVAASPDPDIVEITRKRHLTALKAAMEIGAQYYIAHTNFTPLIRHASYKKDWIKQMPEFWLPLADEAGRHGITICLENVWEPSPDIQAELIAAGNHPCLRASFDSGHALIFSKISADQWIAILGPLLAHCHLHDNFGEWDEHKPIGSGNEDWPTLMRALCKHASSALLVAESDHLANNRSSITALRDLAKSQSMA